MRTWLLISVFFGPLLVFGQKPYNAKKTSEKIVLDGVLDESAWRTAEIGQPFVEQFPSDSIPAKVKTEIRFTYDDKFVYFSGKMYNTSKNRKYVTPSLRRDFRGAANDMLVLTIDPFQDNTNAFQFGVNPFGVQREGLVANGGARPSDLSLSWDNKWQAAAKQYEGYWIAEGAIPLSTIRYNEGATKWNFKFYRVDSETGERSVSYPTPQNFRIYSLAFVEELVFEEPLKKAGTNISLIPYIASGVSRDFEDETQTSSDGNFNVGGDAKIGLGPSLNLDLTVNPDFSQVEVDQQITNLDRFEIFFPERRQFFLENADLFASFGHPLARPFFSRRIGVARDTSTGQNLQNKIHFGARLSGKIGNDWRVGLLNMQAAKDESINLPNTNYTVAAIQKKVFARSNIGAVFINRQAVEDHNGEFNLGNNNFNRVIGIDYNHASKDNKWNGKLYYHHSLDSANTGQQFSHGGWIGYQSKSWTFNLAHVWIGDDFEADVGFVRRTGFYRFSPEFGYNFFPKSNIISRHGPNFDSEFFWVDDNKTDHNFTLSYAFDFVNTSRLNIAVNQTYTYLLDPFDPTRTDGEELAANTDYTYESVSFNFTSDFRKQVGYRISGSIGEYFEGERTNASGELNYRFQPFGSISLTANYNSIKMPEPYNDANLWLIGPRLDLTMTRSLFFTTFVQYNSQIDNLNINSRFQWRFAPVSDIFLVYTDNYGTENADGSFGFGPKNRALIFKVTYWFNP